MSTPSTPPRQRTHLRVAVAWTVVAATLLIAALLIGALAVGGFPSIRRDPEVTAATLFELLKLVFAVVAGVGGAVALVVAYRKQQINETADQRAESEAGRNTTRLFNERYGSASAQLGSENAAIRLAGVYAMARLADDWPDGRQTCIDVLCAYLRMPYAPPVESTPSELAAEHDPPPDTDAIKEWTDEQNRRKQEQQVRHTVFRVIGQHLRNSANVSWQNREFDFTNAIIDGADLHDARFSGAVIFDGAQFSGGKVVLDEADFSGGYVSFDGATFCGSEMSFSSAKFSGAYVSFNDAKINGGKIILFGAEFSGGWVVFDQTEFSGGEMSFHEAQFSGSEMIFNDARFSGGELNFFTSKVSGGEMCFNRAEFSGGEVCFMETHFSGGKTSFSGAKFSGGEVTFHKTKFSGGVMSFDRGEFSEGEVAFSQGEFSGGEVTFLNARFSGGVVDLRGNVWAITPKFDDIDPRQCPPGLRLPAKKSVDDDRDDNSAYPYPVGVIIS